MLLLCWWGFRTLAAALRSPPSQFGFHSTSLLLSPSLCWAELVAMADQEPGAAAAAEAQPSVEQEVAQVTYNFKDLLNKQEE